MVTGTSLIKSNDNDDQVSFPSDKDSHSEIQVTNSDPLKTVDHEENPSTYMKSSKATIKQAYDSQRVIARISSSENRLKYKYLEYMLYIVTLAILSLKLDFQASLQWCYKQPLRL